MTFDEILRVLADVAQLVWFCVVFVVVLAFDFAWLLALGIGAWWLLT